MNSKNWYESKIVWTSIAGVLSNIPQAIETLTTNSTTSIVLFLLTGIARIFATDTTIKTR